MNFYGTELNFVCKLGRESYALGDDTVRTQNRKNMTAYKLNENPVCSPCGECGGHAAREKPPRCGQNRPNCYVLCGTFGNIKATLYPIVDTSCVFVCRLTVTSNFKMYTWDWFIQVYTSLYSRTKKSLIKKMHRMEPLIRFDIWNGLITSPPVGNA